MQEASDDVANDAADREALFAAARALAGVENGGELSTEGAVDVLVMFVRSPDCKRHEEEIKALIALLAKATPEVGYHESRRIVGAFDKALYRGKDVGHLKSMYLNSRPSQ